ncbi:type-2 ice-structuring protein-like [Epinephelus fuscoguttatus]|uniref:type-2 ice-structuring protein-like n=1 Tax=Epinephelus fuscoguttatus TaxID=293821 RepID=UPI0020D183F1|nr:type-2 ice-structuring protein-like [Epinephelus fuscoguttatus]
MKMLIVSALVCAMMVLTRAAAPPEETPPEKTTPPEETPQNEAESHLVKRWFVPSLFKKLIAIKKLFIKKLFGLKKSFVPVKWCVGRGACPWGWSECKGHCYRYVSTPMTWASAEKNCQSMGGNLASAHNIREYHAIQDVIFRATRSTTLTWIGGCDLEREHYWFWSDGTSFNYQRWCDGEPNNGGGAGQHCLQMNYSADKCWDDLQCTRQLPSVCARKR